MSTYVSPPQAIVVPRQTPPLAAEQRSRDTVADIIQRAVASDVPRLVRAADKVQDLIDALEEDVREHERGAQLRAEADRLKARLAEIQGQLTGKQPTAVRTAGSAVDTKAVRRWAAAHNVDCPDRGRVPRAVVAAYEKAQES